MDHEALKSSRYERLREGMRFLTLFTTFEVIGEEMRCLKIVYDEDVDDNADCANKRQKISMSYEGWLMMKALSTSRSCNLDGPEEVTTEN